MAPEVRSDESDATDYQQPCSQGRQQTLNQGGKVETTRRATYVFRQESDGRWLCTVDNSYGTALLDAENA
jgi:hypothetical protein